MQEYMNVQKGMEHILETENTMYPEQEIHVIIAAITTY